MVNRELSRRSSIPGLSVGLAALLLSLLGASPAFAQLRSFDLRFRPPADSRVVGFHVYVSGNSMSYADYRDDINFIPNVDGSGVATYRLTGLEQFRNVYLAMRSYDASGAESAFSNEIVLAAEQQCLVTGCNDNNPCTVDTCTATGCTFNAAPNVGQTCNDGNSGTFNDVCTASGACVGTVAQCNVAADCPAPTNQCAGPQVCSNHMCVAGSALSNGTACNDGNATTRYDICESGTCRGYACNTDSQCGDGEACNGTERCVSRTCVAGTPMVCGDGNVCNGTETCRNSTCQAGTAMTCPADSGPCFDAYCDPVQGCRVSVYPDGTTCTTATTNAAGMCASGVCVASSDPGTTPTDPTRDPRPADGGTPTTCEYAFGAPSDVHQALTSSPETSRKIVWSAPLHPMGSVLQYRADYVNNWTTLRAFPESSSGCDAVWSVTLTGLKSRTRYYYRVSGAAVDGRTWSETLSLRTSSVSLRDRFKFAFFASNGVDGTAQSPQAREVVDQLKKGGFPLVLGGGGYALSNEAIAAGLATDADSAVAKWKEQARPVTGNSIFVPVLGDTEVESTLHRERVADYLEYMSGTKATATSGAYSFDYASVHFVGLAAPNLLAIHPGNSAGAAQLAWLDANLAAARAAGARWIVVYLHTDVFTSERNDPNQGPVRTAFGNILQKYGVNLVLSGEGNSYERTRALSGNLANPTIGALTNRVTTATDGVVFVRAGSGGRTAFGRWLSPSLPGWSAMRDNTRAVFLGIVAGDKNLVLTASGLDANGKRVSVDLLEIR